MNDRTFRPTTPTGLEPRRLTGVPAIDGSTEEPFKLTTQVGTVDLVLLDNEGEPHKIGEATVEPGHIAARIDDADAVRYLSGGTITLDRLDILAEHSWPVEPILAGTAHGRVRVGHVVDMPSGLQITITDRVMQEQMRGPLFEALAGLDVESAIGAIAFRHRKLEDGSARDSSSANAFNEGEVGWHNGERLTRADSAIRASDPPRYTFKTDDGREVLQARDMLDHPPPGGFTTRTEVSEVGPATFGRVHPGDTYAHLPIVPRHEEVGALGRQFDRHLLTADDFPTNEEFELYRIGAAAMPTAWPMIPGSYEVALIRACAAMVGAGINRHEARMAPAGDDLGLSTAPADAGSGRPSPLVQRLEDMANRAAQIMIWSRSEKGVVVEQIREFVREVAELLPAAAEKYAILAGLKASKARRDAEFNEARALLTSIERFGGETCRSILRDALQAPLDDTRTDAQLARDLVDRIKQGAQKRLEVQRGQLDALLAPPRDDLADLHRDAGGRGWLNNLWGVSEGTRPRDKLMLALQQGAEARADMATIAGARPSKSLQRVDLDGEVFMLPSDIAAEILAADDRSPERTLIAVRGAAAMQGRILELEAGIGLARAELDGAAEEDSIDRRDQAMREANRQLARVR